MIRKIMLFVIFFYKRIISPLKRPVCRFSPSCSEYAYQSITKYGIFRGGWKSFKRILSCHPFNPGGIDYP